MVLAVRIVSRFVVTLLPYDCSPPVVIVPPWIAVVPLLAFCVNVVATTVDERVVVPVLVREIFPNPREPPIAPVNVTLPLPVEILRLLFSPVAESTVLAKRTSPFVLVVIAT